jgi:hypothetical protein
MVANTNRSKNRNPKLAPLGVLVTGLDKKYRKAKYGSNEEAKNLEAKSGELRADPEPDTDHASTAV